MHLGFYLDEWRDGGVPAFIRRAMRGLADMGDATTLFLARPHPKREPDARSLQRALREELGVRCVSLDLPAYPPRWRKAHFVETIAKSGIDCLFASQFRAQENALQALSAHLPIVGIAHNDLDYYYHEYLAGQPFLAAEVAVSEAVLETCLRYTPPADRGKVVRIPYGAHTLDDFNPQRSGGLNVIYCSRLDAIQKRSLDLVPVWKSFLDQEGCGTLTVIGSGKALASLQNGLAREIALGSIRFLGQIDDHEVYRAMSQGDVILNLSNFEGLPQTVLEGASLGLWPLLSDTRSGHREIVREVGFGTVRAIGDIPAFAHELLALYRQIDELRQGQAARSLRAREVYSQQKSLRAYHDLAERLARAFTPPPASAPYRPRLSERLRRPFLLANYSRHMH